MASSVSYKLTIDSINKVRPYLPQLTGEFVKIRTLNPLRLAHSLRQAQAAARHLKLTVFPVIYRFMVGEDNTLYCMPIGDAPIVEITDVTNAIQLITTIMHSDIKGPTLLPNMALTVDEKPGLREWLGERNLELLEDDLGYIVRNRVEVTSE